MKHSCVRVAALVLLACARMALVAEEVKLPGIALSLSQGNYMAELHEADAAGGRVKEFVLPEVEFSPGRLLDLSGCREIIRALAGASLPLGRVWLRLKLFPADAGVPADGVEQAVARSVDDLAAQIDFTCFGILLEADSACSGELVRLVVQSVSTVLKAGKDDLLVTVSGKIAIEMDRQIPAYVDRVLLNGRGEWESVGRRLAAQRSDRPLALLVTAMPGADSRRDYLDAFFAFAHATWEMFVIEKPQPGSVEALLRMVDGLRRYFQGNLVRIEEASPFFKLSAAGAMLGAQMVFTDISLNRAVILARLDGSLADGRRLRLATPENDSFRLTCIDPLASSSVPIQAVSSAQLTWQKDYLLLLAEKSQRRDDSIDESLAVSARVGLSLEEIVARWQRYDTRQKQLIRNYIARAEMDMHFEPPGVGTSFDVSLHFQYFWNMDGTQYWEQTAQFLNGIKLPGKSSFPLPQLEPEQVTAQPLELKLVESYIYRLEKNETIDGRECYVLSFRPRPGIEQALYNGRIWIDCATFRKLQVFLVQNNCSGSILSNQELQHFELVAGPGGAEFNLLRKSEVEQKVLAAGREFMLERQYRFDGIQFNSEEFDARFQQALKGNSPMFTETKDGLREFKLAKDGTRQVKEKVDTRIWSLVFGALYDDTANFPIPFVGASTIDYDFLKTRSQLSAFLVLPLLALNLSKQYKGNITLGTDLAVSAMPRNDSPYRDGADVEAEAVRFFSGSFGLRGSWRPVKDLSLTLTSYLVYELFLAQKETADDFVLPRNGLTVNPNLDLDYSRGGYRLTLSGQFYQRLGWRDWGRPGSVDTLQKNFVKYSASLGKRFYIGSFTRIGAEIAYFSGLRLDRFSGYQPSLLGSPKIRGVGSSAITLESVGVLSVNLGFTILDFIRLDSYYNFARAKEYQGGGTFIDFQGMELDFGTVGPWGSYIQGRVTYALAGPLARYQSRWGVYLVMFVPFRK